MIELLAIQRTSRLKTLEPEFVDGENNRVMLDVAYALSGAVDLEHAISTIMHKHGSHTLLLPMSARSSGGGVFQVSPPSGCTTVGLSVSPSSCPRCTVMDDAELTDLALDQIVICPQRSEILVGAAITLNQINEALAATFDMGYRVLGADLTSCSYAQAGATFMTGGMGPQRRYFSDSVVAASLFDGECLRVLDREELPDYAGTYGWTGLIHAVRCHYTRVPPNEIAFALPVHSSAVSISRLLAHLAPWCFLTEQEGKMVNQQGGSDLILGIEYVTLASMEPMLKKGGNHAVYRQARRLATTCQAAGCDGLVFVNGYTAGAADDFLISLLDAENHETTTLAGMPLEHTTIFHDPEEMRSVRESIPSAARTQMPDQSHVYKNHTDATIRLHSEHIEPDMHSLWSLNQKYVDTLTAYFHDTPGVQGQILNYGHMNPWGVDPHNRVTLACDEDSLFRQATEFVEKQRYRFYRALHQLCSNGTAQFIGGEKGAGSEREILTAFDPLTEAPTALVNRFRRQQNRIQSTPWSFRWRALPPYINPIH